MAHLLLTVTLKMKENLKSYITFYNTVKIKCHIANM